MKFSSDENKDKANQKKHRVSFETAEVVFDDPHRLSIQDRYTHGEERWQTIGMVGERLLLHVAHTWYEDENEEECIRIISARRATSEERRAYEKRII